MNNRQRMRASNKLVREYLLEHKYDHIWFKPHGKRNDYVFTQRGKYMAQDIWNLFDGICLHEIGPAIIFLQMKTNAWASEKEFKRFQSIHECIILSFNVSNKLKGCNRKYKVFVRSYPRGYT